MPPNGHIIGHKMMPNSVSITAAKKQHPLKNTVRSLPDKCIVFLGRTFRRLMHIDPYSLDRVEGFGENRQPYRPFPQRRHGHGTRSRNLPCGIVRHRGRSLPERHRTPPARLWWSAGTDERLRGALPGAGGAVAQRRTLEKRAWHPP